MDEDASDRSSLSSRGSPPDVQDCIPFCHEHPVITFQKWVYQQLDMKKSGNSYEDYVTNVILATVTTPDTVLFYMHREKECDCYFFRKSKKCFHVLSPVNQENFETITNKLRSENLRSLLLCDKSDAETLSGLLKQISVIGQGEEKDVRPAYKCKRCKFVVSAARKHQCSNTNEIYSVHSWRYKLPFVSKDGRDIIFRTNYIPLRSAELHHLIPVVSKVYERLEVLEIRTSLVQLLAQDPLYQETLDVFEYQKKDNDYITYHLYLYLVHRLLPLLEKLSLQDVDRKLLPVYTLIRTKEIDVLRDIIGSDEDAEINIRLNSCPEECRDRVRDLLNDILKKEKETNSDEANKHFAFDYNKMCENMIVDGLDTSSMKEEFAYLVRCLDVKMPTYKYIRAFIALKFARGESNDWKFHNDFCYSDSPKGQIITNIFGVIPRTRVSGKLLMNAVLLSRGHFNYKNNEPWRHGVKRPFKSIEI
ncbi:uncharacterized protein LOC123006142 [Tribolium madens]|uniref:uncharacterized protein LOC123006142 n=1 Tax=Tribolium madens TaxID=41895 RepID=UPI001CF72AB3|nr:uncharacterized protein LOC123006142 [Tribolium madens]